MPVWICLLRGVNLGATNKLNMSALRQALTDAGLSQVRTYLQSGNVVLGSDLTRPEEVAEIVGAVIKDRFRLAVPVIVRTPDRLRHLAHWCPFGDDAAAGAVVHFVHLASRPAADRVTALVEQDWKPDDIAIDDVDVAIRYATSMHKSRLQHSRVLRRLGVDGTARNWRTLQALVDLTADA